MSCHGRRGCYTAHAADTPAVCVVGVRVQDKNNAGSEGQFVCSLNLHCTKPLTSNNTLLTFYHIHVYIYMTSSIKFALETENCNLQYFQSHNLKGR